MENKIYIVVGHYGSGESEFSVNLAKRLKTQQKDVCLCDLDVVNPYFRSRETRQELMDLGIHIVSDTLNSTKGLDMPYLSPAIRGQVVQHKNDVILDCGGDDVGIRVLKQYQKELTQVEYEMFMMINVFRPQTSRVDQILDMKNKLENESGLKITGFINNSNFLKHTTVDDILFSNRIISEVSSQTHIPIIYVSGLKNLINRLPDEVQGERFVLELSLRNEWM